MRVAKLSESSLPVHDLGLHTDLNPILSMTDEPLPIGSRSEFIGFIRDDVDAFRPELPQSISGGFFVELRVIS